MTISRYFLTWQVTKVTKTPSNVTRFWMAEGTKQERLSETRIREAAALEDVNAIVVACPKDVTMYRDAIKTGGTRINSLSRT